LGGGKQKHLERPSSPLRSGEMPCEMGERRGSSSVQTKRRRGGRSRDRAPNKSSYHSRDLLKKSGAVGDFSRGLRDVVQAVANSGRIKPEARV